MLAAFLPLVEMRESLPVSVLPADTPFDVDPSGRVLELWHAPLIDPEATVRCIGRMFQRAGDKLRLVMPGGAIRLGPAGEDAQNTAIAWHYVRGTSRLRVVVVDSNSQTLSDELYTPATEHGVDTLDDMSALAPTDNIDQVQVTVTVQRDFGDGYADCAVFSHEFPGFSP